MINLQKGVAMTSIDTSGPRPWPGQALPEDIHPGVIIVEHTLSISDPATVERSQEWVVVSKPTDAGMKFWVVTPAQARRFTYREIVTELKLRDLGIKMDMYYSGIGAHLVGGWAPRTYCTIKGMIDESW